MKHIAVLLILIFSALTFVSAQRFGMDEEKPVETKCYTSTSGDYVDVCVQFNIANSWHVYGTKGGDGPTWTTINVENINNLTAEGDLQADGEEHKVFDKMFGIEVSFFENSAIFKQRYKIGQNSEWSISGYLEYGACNNESCLPPTSVYLSLNGKATHTDKLTESTN
ncbi:MAG: protein-disulfide reductase DsbD family protein [Bacteroidia bacterium]|nr:protein-disulfide reductase DsbD family protein [Bacteroidia bacterium]